MSRRRRHRVVGHRRAALHDAAVRVRAGARGAAVAAAQRVGRGTGAGGRGARGGRAPPVGHARGGGRAGLRFG